MTDDPSDWWDEAYESDVPWDIGRPQPAFIRLAEAGWVEDDVLDVGCGTGTLTRFLAARGHRVTGIDISTRAIERAQEAHGTDERDLDVEFRVGDVLALDGEDGPYATVVDSGTFHVFERRRRSEYADAIGSVLAPGGRAFVLAFGEYAPADWGPTPVSPADVHDAFDDGWRVLEVREDIFETMRASVPATLASLERP